MVTAARILGDQVGSTAPLFLAFLAVHVLAGLTAVDRRRDRRAGAQGQARGTSGRAAGTTGRSPSCSPPPRSWPRCAGGRTITCSSLARWRSLPRPSATSTGAATGPADTGHIAGMGIAYTAMLTAFYVDNGPHLPLWDRLPTLTFWLVPSAIGAPIITRAILRAKHAHGCAPNPPEHVTAAPGREGAAAASPAF